MSPSIDKDRARPADRNEIRLGAHSQRDLDAFRLLTQPRPPQDTPPADSQLRCGPHSDYGSLTIVSSDTDIGGMQVLTGAGDWANIPCLANTFVVNLGDLMAEWTNDRWRSTMHRVINPPRESADQSRLSFLFFHQPNYDAVIECLPTCTNPDDPPKYTTVTSGEHVRRKVELSRAPDLDQAARPD